MTNSGETVNDIEDQDFDEIVTEFETSETIGELLNVPFVENKIKYGLKFGYPNNWKPFEISFDDVDKYDFKKGFNEFLIKPEYVHLYFDFDQIQTSEECDEVYDWLEKLKSVFGKYSIGGYSDNEEFAELMN